MFNTSPCNIDEIPSMQNDVKQKMRYSQNKNNTHSNYYTDSDEMSI